MARKRGARTSLAPCAASLGAGEACLETNSIGIVRTMFVLYTLLIVGGIVLFVTVGLTQQ